MRFMDIDFPLMFQLRGPILGGAPSPRNMRRNPGSRQRQTQISDRRILLLPAALAAAAAADWYLFSGSPAPRARVSLQAEPPRQTLVADREASHPEALAAGVPFQPSPGRADAPVEPQPPVFVLEAQFRAAQGKDERIDLAGQIANWNNASAVEALGRLFTFERHPDIKLALITDLNDIDSEAAPETRLALLASALRDQPRNIRAAALDSLAQIEDPRVEPILQQAMSNDPDEEMREQAAAIYRALYAGAAP